MADRSQLGTSERIRDKMVKLRLANHSSAAATPVATIGREGMMVRDLEERVRTAEGKAREAEGRVEVTEERVVSAEERSREAEERVRVAEDRVVAAEGRATLASREAEGRVREAEERVGAAEVRERASEERSREAEERIRVAEDRVVAAEERVKEAEEKVRLAEKRVRESEERRKEADRKVRAAEEKSTLIDLQAEERVKSAEGKVREAEERVREAEERVVGAERRATVAVREADERVMAADRRSEKRVRAAEVRANEAEERIEGAERSATLAVREADELARAAEGRAREAEEGVRVTERQAEERVREAEGSVREAEERVGEGERLIQEVRSQGEERVREAEERAQASEERARAAESDVAAERQWVVERREIHITEDVLGGGAWGEVKVAIFRGTKVAAKSLYQAIRSDYYCQLFTREMNMASRIRHPNLVQFIGACMEDGMVILTELMPTSLRRELERNDYHITAHQLIVISLDVAKALSYLHQMQPDPVIHRDISSANVLLEPLADQQWRAKVTDYGSVNFQQQLKSVGPGSTIYASPEAGVPALQSPKMDIFSFGVLLIEMCAKTFPEVSARERLIASIRDPEWVELIRRCIDESRDNRPSAYQILAELQQRLEHV